MRATSVPVLTAEQETDHTDARGDHGERGGRPEGEHSPGQMRLERCQTLAELGLEAGEVQVVKLPQISPVSGVHGVKPVHEANAECEVRNAELQCRGRTGSGADRDNAKPLNSAFRIPHSALSGGSMFPGLAPGVSATANAVATD